MNNSPTSPSGRARFVEASPFLEALKLCGLHLRYAMLFSALVNVAYLAPTFYMLTVYDMVVPSSSVPSLFFVTIALGLTIATLTYLDALRSRILSAASLKLDRVFATRIYRRAMLDAGSGPQPRVNQLIREFDTIRSAVTGPAALAMFDAPWIPIYIGVCFYLHFAIGALALGGSILLFCLAIWNERSTREHSRRGLEASAASFATQEAAGGAADVVRSMGMTAAFVGQFEIARDRAHLPQIEAARASGRIGGMIRFLRLFLQSSALGLGAWLAIDKQISGGAVFAASMLAARALSPIDQIVAQWRTVSQAISAYGAIRIQLSAEDPISRTNLPTPVPRLALSQVAILTPPKDRVIIRDVTFAAKGGQVVGVIGASGAGKTTLLQVLANARLADQGDIRIDGARYSDWDSERLGRFIGYVPQDCALFPGTVKDNISRFDISAGVDPAMVDEMAVKAAKAAGVHELVLSLPRGYETPIGVRGRGLSAGQQQRIALARALYGDPVLFIFDEPNSNLDAEGEAILVNVISQLRAAGALVIVAAHRISLIACADLLAVIQGGRLDRFGLRDEVLESLKRQSAQSNPSPAPASALGVVG